MTVLDWLAPTDRPFRKGIMLGFDARHTRGHVYRSILEAIALTMKHNVDAMCGELGIALEEIVISGGGSSSPLFMQIFADVFGLPASRATSAAAAPASARRSAPLLRPACIRTSSPPPRAWQASASRSCPMRERTSRLPPHRRQRLPGHPHRTPTRCSSSRIPIFH